MNTIITIGNHKVVNSEITKLDVSLLLGGKKVGLFYTDPPWGDGNIKYWATINAKDTGERIQPLSMDRFMNILLDIASHWVDGYVFVEYGVRWRDFVRNKFRSHGIQWLGMATVNYKGGGKIYRNDIHIGVSGNYGLPEGFIRSVSNTIGLDTVVSCLEPFKDKFDSVFDPCCGLGTTAKAAKKLGLTFYGAELNKKRLGRTIEVLRK